MGDYDKAYELASRAYVLNPYNRMAFTLKVQSQIAKEWQHFINDANNFFKKIEEIANKPIITKKDKLRIKLMLEILIDEYKTLKPSLLLPKELKEEAKEKYLKAKKLYEELFGKRDK
jgi:tetratricopeptide (TPR) repeat protein